MLITEINVGGRIQIGDNISIIAVATKGDSVRIGIDAPASIPIHRPPTGRTDGPVHKATPTLIVEAGPVYKGMTTLIVE